MLAAVAALGLLLASVAGAHAAAPYFTVTDLGTLGGANSIANDINDAGQIVGAADLPDGSIHACIWSGGPIQDMGSLGGSPSEALRININGVAVGYAYDASGTRKPARWTNGVLQDLTPGGPGGIAHDINDSGQIVGNLGSTPVIWSNGSYSIILTGTQDWVGGEATAISNTGIIATSSQGIWVSNQPSRQVSTFSGVVNAINASGNMAVTGTPSKFAYDTPLLNLVASSLGDLGGQQGRSLDINNADLVVGQSLTAAGDWHAVIFNSSVGLVDLNKAIAPGQGWVFQVAHGINNAGQIVGQGLVNGHLHAFLLNPATPPPAPSVQVNTSLDLGSVAVNNTSQSQTLTITNTGDASLTISGVTLAGTNSGDFQVSGGMGLTVTAGASTDLIIKFGPKAIGSRSASLTITSNADNGPNTVALTGTGTGAQVQADAAHSFGYVIVGASSLAQIVAVTNTGNSPLTISSLSFSGANPADFTVTGGTGVTVPVNGTTQLTVTFAPKAAGNRSASLVITSNAVNSPNSVSLTGTGVAPVPAAPSALKALGFSYNKVSLTWVDNSSDETGFEIYRKSGSGSYSRLTTTAPNSPFFQDTTVSPTTTYSYEVRAANNLWASVYTNEVSVTTVPAPPAAPTGLTATVVTTTQINLKWVDNSSNETAFQVYRQTGTGTYTLAAVLPAGSTRFSDKVLYRHMTYSYQVRAANDYWASAYSNVASAHTP